MESEVDKKDEQEEEEEGSLHTEQFKAEALRAEYDQGNRTVTEVAEWLRVAERRIHDSKCAARQGGTKANDRVETMKQELRHLRRYPTK